MAARNLSSDDWDEQVLRSQEPVAVEFWVPWCPWCRRFTPEFEAISVDYKGKLNTMKLNSDDYPGIAQRNGIMSLLTIKIFCQGRAIGEIVGYMPRPRLKAELEKVMQTHRECLENSSPMRR